MSLAPVDQVKNTNSATENSHNGMNAIHVVALALINEKNQILVAKRPDHKDLGGLWEFPGGKLEAGETAFQGLTREILEELNYQIKKASPLKAIDHEYPDFSVHLDVWVSRDQNPQVHSNEGQEIRWVDKMEINQLQMPEADKPILKELNAYLENQ